jgi:TorA maturation chaperone TorD
MSTYPPQTQCRDEALGRFRHAVSEDLLTLALLHDRELDRERILAMKEDGYSDLFGLKLESSKGKEAVALFRRGLTDIPKTLDQASLDILAAEYADIYLNNSFSASPCESVWIDEDQLMMQEPMFQIRNTYTRHGLAVPDWRTRTDDHLVYQLQFISYLMVQDSEQGLREVAKFMDEHILRWIGDFTERLTRRCATRFYAGLAQLTAAYLDELRDILVQLTGESRPSAEEVATRMRPKLSIAAEEPGPFVPGAAPSW